jgi:hypothetical protein
VSDEDLIPENPPDPEHVSGALMFSFGAVHAGREAIAVDTFVEVSRYLGRLLAEGAITGFAPYFFADGQLGDVSGFFLVEGHRERLDALRRTEDFQRIVLRAGAATANVRVHTLIAGTEAGRLVHLYRSVREELGLV